MLTLSPHTITLSICNSTATEFGVTWQTESEGCPILEYTTADDIRFTKATVTKGKCEGGMGAFRNRAKFHDICIGKSYLWRVGDESGIYSDIFKTQFPLHSDDKLTFLVVTDTQDEEHHGTWMKYPTIDALNRIPEAEFIIHTGDMVQEGGNAGMWRMMTENTSDFFLSKPVAAISGNHDYWRGYLHNYRNILDHHYYIDYPPQDTSNGIYYSFDCGPAHFTMLSSGDSMETDNRGVLDGQLEWAINDIKSTDKKWKFVCVHNPFYSPGKYGCRADLCTVALALREQFNQVFAESGVDMVFCGHDHVYAQTFPISADGEPIHNCSFELIEANGENIKYFIDPEGPIHLESGCLGHQSRGFENWIGEEHTRFFDEMSPMTYGGVAYTSIKIEGNLLKVCFREINVNDGSCIKQFAFGIKKTK